MIQAEDDLELRLERLIYVLLLMVVVMAASHAAVMRMDGLVEAGKFGARNALDGESLLRIVPKHCNLYLSKGALAQ